MAGIRSPSPGEGGFRDGMVIPASFTQDIRLGVAPTIAVAMHEVPRTARRSGLMGLLKTAH